MLDFAFASLSSVPAASASGSSFNVSTLASATRVNAVHSIDLVQRPEGSAICEYFVSLASRTYSRMHRRKLLFMLAQLPAVNRAMRHRSAVVRRHEPVVVAKVRLHGIVSWTGRT